MFTKDIAQKIIKDYTPLLKGKSITMDNTSLKFDHLEIQANSRERCNVVACSKIDKATFGKFRIPIDAMLNDNQMLPIDIATF